MFISNHFTIQVTALDDDKPNTGNSNVTYTLHGNSNPNDVPFAVDITSGDVKINGPISVEEHYSFLVSACDQPTDVNER